MPSEGVWQPHMPPIRTMELNRPTRLDRFKQVDSGAGLHQALIHLFEDVELTLPVWLLIPKEWVQIFHMENPNLHPEEMQRAHILWEAQQRLAGDINKYSVMIPKDLTTAKFTIYLIREDVIELFNKEANKANFEIAGIFCEPEWGSEYSFETPIDFREAIPANLIDTTPTRRKAHVPNFIPIIVGIAVLALTGYIWHLPTGEKPKTKPKTTVVKQDSSVSTETGKFVQQEETPTLKPTSTISGAGSPLSQLLSSLPDGAGLQFAVVSPMDLKVEIAGLSDPSSWMKELKKSANFKSATIAGNYRIKGANITVIRLTDQGWQTRSGGKQVEKWIKTASSQGMNVKGTSARGNFASALKLAETLWAEPGGFEKLYLAPDKGQWIVTVQ